MAGIGSHQRPVEGATNDWITPREIIEALGPFDLDPCACIPQPWPCAAKSYTVEDNGLAMPWCGRVWLNPPYGPHTGEWLHRLAEHGQGTALVFARTETEMFDKAVWRRATGILFIRRRISFYRPDGSLPPSSNGGPSVLIAYGNADAERLRASGIGGAFCMGWDYK